LTIEGEDGSFKVFIDSEGKWDDSEQQHKYQVRQTDGKLYEEGKFVGEDELHRTQK
jgi:hypothetical protein